jgi:signal peptidase I
MGNIISQQCVYYKYNLLETKVNMYGESAEGHYFQEPIILFCLIDRNDQQYLQDGIGVDFVWGAKFAFLIDDLTQANLFPEVGDIIQYQEGYFEVNGLISNQLFVGKDPEYPNYDSNNNNPLNSGLENFGYNTSVVVNTHYAPVERINIIKSR